MWVVFDRIVYIKNILEYTCKNEKEITKARLVNNSWYECVMEYNEDACKKIYMNYKSEYGDTLLHLCAKKGEISIMRILLQRKCESVIVRKKKEKSGRFERSNHIAPCM